MDSPFPGREKMQAGIGVQAGGGVKVHPLFFRGHSPYLVATYEQVQTTPWQVCP